MSLVKLYKFEGQWVWMTKYGEVVTDQIPKRQAYEWVKTGQWNLQEFIRWVEDREKSA